MRHFKIHYSYMRDPKTQQERRANQDKEYVRGKRLPNSLPTCYDDIRVRGRKTWKDRRKTQYRESRGQKHVIKITDKRFYNWEVERYFDKFGIPYHFETIRKPEYRPEYRWKLVPDKERQKLFPWAWPVIMKRVYEPTGNTVRYSVFDYYTLTWWSDKDIGIDYILQSTQHPDFEGYE